ncbi:hypothetical protein PIB30_083509 [Stylosanthes scabra]|uniref:Uncharacterized protein n=1 Tax=Stylosanthes scabra TaxID=79078 RepID=A0ABU6VSG1_9FABA|nr:hypothetical protein [Stylosanthes scabra]
MQVHSSFQAEGNVMFGKTQNRESCQVECYSDSGSDGYYSCEDSLVACQIDCAEFQHQRYFDELFKALMQERGPAISSPQVVPTTHAVDVDPQGGVICEKEILARKKDAILRKKVDPKNPTPLPYHISAKKHRKTKITDPRFIELLKKVEVTLPLFEVIQQVPKYTRFLKEICTHKNIINELDAAKENQSISDEGACSDPLNAGMGNDYNTDGGQRSESAIGCATGKRSRLQ